MKFKFFLFSFFLFLTKFSFSTNTNYDLINLKTDFTYYNFIQFENKLFIGTNEGVIEVNEIGEIENLDKKQKGYIKIVGNKIIGGNLTEDITASDLEYNYLLPGLNKNSNSRVQFFKNHLFLINTNKLYIFKKYLFKKSYDSLNIRTSSKNYIGSYNGIFKNGIKLSYPLFTDGYIREFKDETFICYGGLFRIINGKNFDYYNSTNGETRFNNIDIGASRDIMKLFGGYYEVTTNKGIYLINFNQNTLFKILNSKKLNEYFLAFNLNSDNEDLKKSFYFTDNDKIYIYNTITNTKNLILDTKSQTFIKDVFIESTSVFYVLYENQLKKFTKNYASNLFEEAILVENLSFTHNLQKLNNFLIISTNVGAHLYNIKTNKFYQNIIPFETNRRSLTKIDDTIRLAISNGIVSFTEEDAIKMISEIENKDFRSYYLNSNNKNYIIFFLTLVIILLIFYFFFSKSKASKYDNNNNNSIIENKKVTKEMIIDYIEKNITNVTLQSICKNFEISTLKLYEILQNEKPGEIIRKYRIKLVRMYRKEMQTDEFISNKTGFSISYLKKIL